ncbi:hypothetical protein [Cupriavidus alkaliphilus]|uniref:hypothetical protein n=1 Tax=Cupriavidus alkaliphilus TaxID=942866 RepID=UPI00161A00AB|nr:hypothetical protein [Cupriavidus alkaliphilus]MBB2917383.1 hypothetical protein [Cupriavidus alkaliphilus]
MQPGIETSDRAAASASASDKPGRSDAFKAGIAIGMIVGIATIMVIALGEVDPYPLGGNQSLRWWLLRFPLVFAGLFIFVAAQTLLAAMIRPIGTQISELGSGLLYFLFPCALVLVAFEGATVMNLYNAAYGTPSSVTAQRWTTIVQPSAHRTPARTYVQYKVLTGPMKDEVFSVGRDGSIGHGSHGDNGKPAVLYLRRSWMGASVVRVKE